MLLSEQLAKEQAAKMSRPLPWFVASGKKIVGIGRNFADHAKELGNAVPSEPMMFLKPTTSYIVEGEKIKIPKGCTELHHEVELGVVIGKEGSEIPSEAVFSDGYIAGYCLALDMTARDFQEKAKKKGHPWSIAKGFNTSCPVSDMLPMTSLPNPHDVELWLKVNSEDRQRGSTRDMIFDIPTLVAAVSDYFTLQRGDVILTGTPSGVGPVGAGDVITAGIGEIVRFQFEVAGRQS